MKDIDLANKLVELRIALRSACLCEEKGKALLCLKTKVLYCIATSDKATPHAVMAKLHILKPNLASIAKSLIKEKLITRRIDTTDARNVNYLVTEMGKEYLTQRLERIDEGVRGVYNTENEYKRLEESIDEILKFLDKCQL